MVINSEKIRLESLRSYIGLIEKLIAGRMSLDQFERRYYDLFKAEETIWSNAEFDILNDLFMDLDSYNSDPTLRGPDDLDEAQMLIRIPKALEGLKTIVRNLEGNPSSKLS